MWPLCLYFGFCRTKTENTSESWMEAMLEREKMRQEVKEKELELRDRELNEHILANERDREERRLKIQANIEIETNGR